MCFLSGCNHPSFAFQWRTLLAHLVALHLLHLGSAQLTVVAPSLRVTAIVGQDVVLRCYLSPCKDAGSSDIRWIQHQSSGLVHHYQNGVDLEQMEEYKGRTELLRNGLSDGNLDLRITAVRSSDSGSYSCAVEDGDGYAEAVVNLEVSDPFSQIIHPWKVALAMVITLQLGSFVIIAFLYRKQAAQRRELARKDAELAQQAEILERKDAELGQQAEILKQQAAELVHQTEKVENWKSLLNKHTDEMDLSAANLKKQAERLVEQTEALAEKNEALDKQNSQLKKDYEEMDSSAAELKILATKLDLYCEKMGIRDAELKKLAERLVEQTQALAERSEAVEKQNSQLKKDCEDMDLSAADLKTLAAKLDSSAADLKKQIGKLVGRTEELKKQNSQLDIDFSAENLKKLSEKLDSSAADLKEQVAKLVKQIEEMEKENSELKERCEKMGLHAADLNIHYEESEQTKQVEEHSTGIHSRGADLTKELGAESGESPLTNKIEIPSDHALILSIFSFSRHTL
ncbi:selection and upkeep of intraepithelial T-cells protein 6 isoform X22 [Meleagris gallopavo]|uniref:selection and upkeep of intraepithelial T-cells protein 6 isoform X22 n=1 Tax=Meleagris gallopavo TaxID=9103 RepID=UPI0012AB9E7D|nr:selection and upkeep of intraepithelial T-cells protein 6 isoform X22 [Meleagris gallopavo]